MWLAPQGADIKTVFRVGAIMDNNKPEKGEKGYLASAFSAASIRKAVLSVVAGVTLAVGAAGFANEAQAQTTVPYGQQGVTATQQQQKPWANEAAYQERIRLLAQEQQIKMEEALARARKDMANINAQRTQQLKTYNSRVRSLSNNKSGADKVLGIAEATQRWQAQQESLRARATTVENRIENLRIDQQEAMSRLITTMDRQYANQEPYKSMVSGQRVSTTQPAASRPAAASPEDKMDEAMEKARRDAMQKLYKQYLDAEVKAGRIPDSPDDFFQKRQAEQRQQQQQPAPRR